MNGVHHHILHAEDNPDDVLLIQRAFKRLENPCPITSVEDGARAISYLKGEDEYHDRAKYPLPTLALLDIKMPRYSGLEVLEWIRSQPRYSGLPVVIFSSSRNIADIQRAYQLGVNAYLVKPVEYAELQETVKSIISFWVARNVLPI
jgi:CheY-like chemotaxis protein